MRYENVSEVEIFLVNRQNDYSMFLDNPQIHKGPAIVSVEKDGVTVVYDNENHYEYMYVYPIGFIARIRLVFKS